MTNSELIHTWFIRNQLTLAVAESLTCGNLQAAIGLRSGASKFFRGGVTCYFTDMKSKLLNVDATHAAEVNAVSPRVAREMASGVCELFFADFGIGTTGYAEPWPDGGITVPMAHFAIAKRGVGIVHEQVVHAPGLDRKGVQVRVVEAALEGLANYIRARD